MSTKTDKMPIIVLYYEDVDVEKVYLDMQPIGEANNNVRYDIYYQVPDSFGNLVRYKLKIYSDEIHVNKMSKICDNPNFPSTWERTPGYSFLVMDPHSIPIQHMEGKKWAIMNTDNMSHEALFFKKIHQIEERIIDQAKNLEDPINVKHPSCRLSKKTDTPYMQMKTWSGKHIDNTYKPCTVYYHENEEGERIKLSEEDVVSSSFGMRAIFVIRIESVSSKESIRCLVNEVRVTKEGGSEDLVRCTDISKSRVITEEEDNTHLAKKQCLEDELESHASF